MESVDKPRDIRERTFEFAVRIVKLCQRLDEKRMSVRLWGISYYGLERQ